MDPQIILMVITGIILFFTVFLWRKWVIAFYQNKDKPHFQKRSPNLISLWLLVCTVRQYIVFPLRLYTTLEINPAPNTITSTVILIVSVHLYNFVDLLATGRIVVNYMQVLKTSYYVDWKQKIDANYSKTFLFFYRFVGQSSGILAIVSTIIVIQLTLWMIVFFSSSLNVETGRSFADWEAFVLWSAALIISLTCCWKSRHFDDSWFINKELRIYTIIVVIHTVGFTVSGFTVSEQYSSVVRLYFLETSTFIFCYLFVVWPNNQMKKLVDNVKKTTTLTTPTSNKDIQLQSENSDDDDHSNNFDLLKYITNKRDGNENYVKVMNILEKQYASDDLIFLTIMIQWQTLLVRYRLFGAFATNMIIHKTTGISLPPIVPFADVLRNQQDKLKKLRKNLVHIPNNKSQLAKQNFFSFNPKATHSSSVVKKQNNATHTDMDDDYSGSIVPFDSESSAAHNQHIEKDLSEIGESDNININDVDINVNAKKQSNRSNIQLSANLFLLKKDDSLASSFVSTFNDVYERFLGKRIAPQEISVTNDLQGQSRHWYLMLQGCKASPTDVLSIWMLLVKIAEQIENNISHTITTYTSRRPHGN